MPTVSSRCTSHRRGRRRARAARVSSGSGLAARRCACRSLRTRPCIAEGTPLRAIEGPAALAGGVEGHPLRLTATIAGRRIVMRRPLSNSSDGYWEGTLRYAGLLRRGPLHIFPYSGRATWFGRHPRPIFIRFTASYRTRPDATVGRPRSIVAAVHSTASGLTPACRWRSSRQKRRGLVSNPAVAGPSRGMSTSPRWSSGRARLRD
jgi:hypothetical protein